MKTISYKCNLVIPGWPKSGTTSLHEYLDMHPDICMSRPKEPHFFAFDDRYSEGPEKHNALFFHASGTEAYYGESSTIYCLTHHARERIARDLLDSRIIILLRHPVERTVSHYRWMFAQALEHRVFSDALEKNGFDFHPKTDWHGCYKSYLQFSRYSEYIPLWLKIFGEGRVLILFSDDLRKRPEAVLERIFGFLNIAKQPPIKEVHANATESAKPLGMHPIAALLSRTLPEYVKCYYRRRHILKRVWEEVSRPRKRAVPKITEEDLKLANKLLAEEIAYYESLKSHWSVTKPGTKQGSDR